MRKVAVLGGGLVVAGTAALMGAGVALSQPSVETSPYNVVGEQYGRALAILKSQGVKAYFGGSTGSALPTHWSAPGSSSTRTRSRSIPRNRP
mgnify:CR=1 FL=1